MSRKNIELKDFQNAIMDSLREYSDEVVAESKKRVQQVGRETVVQLKTTSPKRSGEYANGWKMKKVFENADKITVEVYNKKPYLPHLLEYGHAKKNGGRVEAIPHIRPAEQAAAEKLEKKVKVVIR